MRSVHGRFLAASDSNQLDAAAQPLPWSGVGQPVVARNPSAPIRERFADRGAVPLLGQVDAQAPQHVNLFGTFEFRSTATIVDLDEIAARYADPTYWTAALKQ